MTLILSGTDGLSDVDGSAATPAIRGTDANTGIFFGADIIGFAEGGAEVARFNADAQFVAAAGTALLPVITTTGDVNTGIFFPAADTIAFAEGGAEAMRLDSSGYVTKISQPAFSVGGTGSGNKTAGTAFGFTDATGGAAQITYNISGSWSNANNRFTAPVAGIYLFNAAIYVQNATSTYQSIAIRLNGAQIASGDSFILFTGYVAAGNTDNQVRGTFTMKLAAGDYVDLAVRSGAATLSYYSGHSLFQGYLLG